MRKIQDFCARQSFQEPQAGRRQETPKQPETLPTLLPGPDCFLIIRRKLPFIGRKPPVPTSRYATACDSAGAGVGSSGSCARRRSCCFRVLYSSSRVALERPWVSRCPTPREIAGRTPPPKWLRSCHFGGPRCPAGTVAISIT